LTAFSVATCLEIGGYYIPWVDHLLDTLATPAAIIAGTIATAAIVTDASPLMKWTLAVIAGGGTAAMVQGTTVVARGASTATTAGLANPVLATAELGGSVITALLAILVPVLLVTVMFVAFVVVGIKLLRRRKSSATAQAT